jgi:predicted MFS family arabinose efflux permease
VEPASTSSFDTAYERRVLLLLGLGCSLVGLQRWILTPLFPAMLQDLRLDHLGLSVFIGAPALCCGLFSILMGALSDRLGRRRVLIPGLLLVALATGAIAAAGGASTVLLLACLVGAGQGAFFPGGIAIVASAARPLRRGLALGLQLSGFALFGFAFTPLIATQLLALTGSWRQVFLSVAIAGVPVALLLWRVIREPAPPAQAAATTPAPQPRAARWGERLRSRNLLLAMLSAACAMCCVFVLAAMLPSYLIDFVKLPPQQVGFVMSALGFGGCIGVILVPAVSDYSGRRAAAVAAFLCAAAALYGFGKLAAEPAALFAVLSLVAGPCLGLIALLAGPVAAEAVAPARAAGAIGMVIGIVEIVGGGIAPFIAGGVAQSRGIEHVLDFALTVLLAGAVVCALLRESAPRRSAAADAATYISTL